MPTAAERLEQVRAKLERARNHLAEAEREIAAFIATQPYRHDTKRQAGTGNLVYYVSHVTPTPKCLPLIAGDAIQALASTLDHLAYQIVGSDTGDNWPDAEGVYFPSGKSAAHYAKRKVSRLKGAAAASVAAIDALTPYAGAGGNELYWRLSKLNNIDKHRTLLTVGSYNESVDLGRYTAQQFAKNPGLPPDVVEALGNIHHGFAPADTGFPLQVGFDLFIGSADDQPDPGMIFKFGVGLHERGVCENASLLATLRELDALVENTIAKLAPLLRDSP